MKWTPECQDSTDCLVLIRSVLLLKKSFPINHAWLISLSFFSELRPGNFNFAKKILESLLDISLKSAAQCAAADKKVIMLLDIVRSSNWEQNRKHHFDTTKSHWFASLATTSQKEYGGVPKKHGERQAKLSREWSSCLGKGNWKKAAWEYENNLQNHKAMDNLN